MISFDKSATSNPRSRPPELAKLIVATGFELAQRRIEMTYQRSVDMVAFVYGRGSQVLLV